MPPVARRIGGSLVLGPALDASYNAVKLATWDVGKNAKVQCKVGPNAVPFPCSTFAVLPRKRASIGWTTDRRAL